MCVCDRRSLQNSNYVYVQLKYLLQYNIYKCKHYKQNEIKQNNDVDEFLMISILFRRNQIEI